MECREVRDQIVSLAEGSLDPSRKTSIARHAAACPRCGEELRRARALRSLVASLAAPAPAELDDRVLEATRRVRDESRLLRARPLHPRRLGCREVAASLAEHVDDCLPVDRRIDVDLHLDECPRCAARVHAAHETADVLEQERSQAPAEIWDRLRPSIEEIRRRAPRRRMRSLLPAEGLPELGRLLPLGSAAAAALALIFASPWLAHRLGGASRPERHGPEIRFVYVDRPAGEAARRDPLLRAILDGFHPDLSGLPRTAPEEEGSRGQERRRPARGGKEES